MRAELQRWTYAGGKQWKGLITRREIERQVCRWGRNEPINRNHLRCRYHLLVSMARAIDHYRDNAINYKDQRDKPPESPARLTATIKRYADAPA